MDLLLKIALTAVLIGVLLYYLFNWKLHCPKCRRTFAAKVTGKKVVKEKKSKEVAWNDKKGADEVQTLKIKTVKYEYTCKYCKHKWKHTKQEY